MKMYLWSPYSPVYHSRLGLTERCNTDALRHRREGDTPPANKRPCQHCNVPRGISMTPEEDLR